MSSTSPNSQPPASSSTRWRVDSSTSWRDLVVGADAEVPVLDGSHRTYVNLDNAATTPALRAARDRVDGFLEWYASVHRGAGLKSRLTSMIFEEARDRVARFVGASPDQTVVFVKSTTEALNKVSYRVPLPPGSVVLTTLMEHHANLLPWRLRAVVDTIEVDDRGDLCLDDLERKLARYQGRVRLIAVSGASNVTGSLPSIHHIARLAHDNGAEILVDAAQLAPHRPIDLLPADDPGHIDYLAFSAHKLYAPYGIGVLVAPRRIFNGPAEIVGGGVVDLVTDDEVIWNGPPGSEEAGSPNAIGAIALGSALETLGQLGMTALADHETELTVHALRRFKEVEGIEIVGSDNPADADKRLGVIALRLPGVHHGLIAAVLGWEYAIGVRNGAFCAHPYVHRLLHLSANDVANLRMRIQAGDRREVPGLVRISFGLYNTTAEIDYLVDALKALVRHEYTGTYVQHPHTGEFIPEGTDAVDLRGWCGC